MSPGPTTTATRGGFAPHYSSFASARFIPAGRSRAAPPYRGRAIGNAVHQRFAVTPTDDGGSKITLDDGETVSIGIGDDGAVEITIAPVPSENGEPRVPAATASCRSLAARCTPAPGRAPQERLLVSQNPDGSVLVEPEKEGALIVSGDPAAGAVEIFEVEPVGTP